MLGDLTEKVSSEMRCWGSEFEPPRIFFSGIFAPPTVRESLFTGLDLDF